MIIAKPLRTVYSGNHRVKFLYSSPICIVMETERQLFFFFCFSFSYLWQTSDCLVVSPTISGDHMQYWGLSCQQYKINALPFVSSLSQEQSVISMNKLKISAYQDKLTPPKSKSSQKLKWGRSDRAVLGHLPCTRG